MMVGLSTLSAMEKAASQESEDLITKEYMEEPSSETPVVALHLSGDMGICSNCGESKILRRASMLLTPEIEEPAVAESDIVCARDVYASGGAINPLG